jgi:hypothetical protein
MRSRRSAAAFIEWNERPVGVILAELGESAGAVARSWHLAAEAVGTNPRLALQHLVEAELRLDSFVRLELRDTIRPIREAIKRLDAEIPDADNDEATLPGQRPTLHDAMITALKGRGRRWTRPRSIADEIANLDLWRRPIDGDHPPPGQISARANRYPELFEISKEGIRLR